MLSSIEPFLNRISRGTSTIVTGVVIIVVAALLVGDGSTFPPLLKRIFNNAPVSDTVLPLQTAAGLTPEEVRGWCQGTHCTVDRFLQLQESNNLINPNGVFLETGDPVALDIPADIRVEVWDCFQDSEVVGPIYLPQVCQASFRRSE